jgi:hypothetical protein
MTTATAIAKLDLEIAQVLKDYDNSPESKDTVGSRIAHLLDTITEPEKLYALERGLYTAAIQCKPRGLWELLATPVGLELVKVNTLNYVRVPATPTNTGDDLDMDEALAYGVIFYAVSVLNSGNGDHGSKADTAFKDYTSAYKEYDLAVAQGK